MDFDLKIKIDLILRKNGVYGGIVENIVEEIMEVIKSDN